LILFYVGLDSHILYALVKIHGSHFICHFRRICLGIINVQGKVNSLTSPSISFVFLAIYGFLFLTSFRPPQAFPLSSLFHFVFVDGCRFPGCFLLVLYQVFGLLINY